MARQGDSLIDVSSRLIIAIISWFVKSQMPFTGRLINTAKLQCRKGRARKSCGAGTVERRGLDVGSDALDDEDTRQDQRSSQQH
jgi:hypothetical protein